MRPLQLTQPGPLLFAAGGAFQALELQGADVPVMQRFFDANPEYNLLINGERPSSKTLNGELLKRIPAGSVVRSTLITCVCGFTPHRLYLPSLSDTT